MCIRDRICARRVEQVIPVEAELVDEFEGEGRTVHLGDGHATVEGHDGRWGHRDQLVVEREDLPPVCFGGRGGIAVHGVDRGLKLIGPGAVAAQAGPHEVLALDDHGVVPSAAVLVVLADQDRSRWDHAMVVEGQDLVRACLRRNRPGPYQLQAAINAVHSDAPTAAETDWGQILALYDQLIAVAPTPVVALNRCVAVAEVHGPSLALELVDQLGLDGYHLFHATRADLLRRLGRRGDAIAAYDAAIARTANRAERSFLQHRRDSL